MTFLKQSIESFDVLLKERNNNIIYIDESHTYYIRKSELKKFHYYLSVSNIVASKFPKFDKDAIATKLSIYHKGKYKYKSKDEIIKKWDSARENGTLLHELLEMYLNKSSTYNFKNNKYSTSDEFKQFKIFEENNKHLVIVKTELRCYSIIYNYAGTLDALYYDNNEKCFIIIDFKRCENLTTKGYCICRKKYYYTNNSTEFLSFIHSDKCDLLGISISTKSMVNCKFVKYSVQINLYREALKEYNIIAKKLFLLNFYKDKPYQFLPITIDENLIKNFNPGL